MKIQYPSDLVAQVKEAVADRKLEGFVPGMGPAHPTIMLVGEAPGRTEVEEGRPFVGASGKELMKMLAFAGQSRETVYITSVVRSRPYTIKEVVDKKSGKTVTKRPNRTPTAGEVHAYGPLFDWEVQTVAPKVVVPLGNTSLRRLLGKEANIGDLHGQVLRKKLQVCADRGYQTGDQEVWVVPMYHPAAYLYARRLEPTVRDDWQRFGEWLKKRDF